MSTDSLHWRTGGRSREVVLFGLDDMYGEGCVVSVWAGGELDPAYLTADGARKAADEWPAILREFADRADAANGRAGEGSNE